MKLQVLMKHLWKQWSMHFGRLMDTMMFSKLERCQIHLLLTHLLCTTFQNCLSTANVPGRICHSHNFDFAMSAEVYCDWQGWKGLKQTVEGLPMSLSGYASYLNARSWIWYTHQNIQFVSYQKTFHLTTFLAALPHHHALVVLSQSYTRSTCWSMCSLRVFVQVSHTWSINTYRLWRPMGCLQTQWC